MATTVRKIQGEITLKATKATGKLKKFNAGMDQSAAKINKSTRATNQLTASTNKFARSATKAKGAAGGFGGALKAIGGLLVLNAFKNQLVETLKAGTDFAEFQQKFDVVFKSSPELLQEAGKAVKLLGKDYGFSVVEGTKLLANTADILTGLGTAPKAAFDMSLAVQKLAGDLASFNNVPVAQASAAITKALLGEREGVVALGIKISENAVLQKIGIERAKKMTDVQLLQAKATATLAIAYEQSKNSLGDFKRSQDSTANQLKILNNEFIALRLQVAEKIMPIFNKLIGIFIKFLPVLKKPIVFIPLLVAGLILLGAALWVVISPLLVIISPFLLIIGIVIAISAAIGLLVAKWETVKAFLIQWKGLLLLLAIPFTPIILLVMGLIKGFKLLMGNKEKIIGFFKGIWTVIKFLLKPFALLLKALNAIGKFVGGVIGIGGGDGEKVTKTGGGDNPPPQVDATVDDGFISKDGKITRFSDQDNISLSKGSGGMGTTIQNLIGSITIQVEGGAEVGNTIKQSVMSALDELSNDLSIQSGIR